MLLCEGKGCAQRLLSVVHGWAERDGVGTYLETDGRTAGFYERKAGYRRVWQELGKNHALVFPSGFLGGAPASHALRLLHKPPQSAGFLKTKPSKTK